MSRAPLLTILLATLAVGPLSARQARDAEGSPGRIRLIPADSYVKPVTGRLVSLAVDSVHLVPEGRRDTVRVARSSLVRIEESVYDGRSQLGRGMAIGGVIGALLGAGALYAWASSGDDGGRGIPRPGVIPVGFAGGALAGGLVGAIIGGASRSHRWVVMRAAGAGPRPDGGRYGLSLHFDF